MCTAQPSGKLYFITTPKVAQWNNQPPMRQILRTVPGRKCCWSINEDCLHPPTEKVQNAQKLISMPPVLLCDLILKDAWDPFIFPPQK
jgi:hypothetical protein